MLSADQFAGASLFPGGASLPSQSIDSSISPTKIRTPQTLIPLTVKQIIQAFHSSEDKSGIIVDGVELANFRLVGLVINRMERDTEVSFTLDDGTGRIDIRRWANENSDSSDSAFIQSVTDFNDIALHFLECVHVHLVHNRLKGDSVRMHMNVNMSTPFSNGRDYLAPFPNQFVTYSSMDGPGKDVYSLVLRMFQEPATLASEHGLHVDELFRSLDLPKNQIIEAINYLVDMGHIYSTVDEYHFKSANNC